MNSIRLNPYKVICAVIGNNYIVRINDNYYFAVKVNGLRMYHLLIDKDNYVYPHHLNRLAVCFRKHQDIEFRKKWKSLFPLGVNNA